MKRITIIALLLLFASIASSAVIKLDGMPFTDEEKKLTAAKLQELQDTIIIQESVIKELMEKVLSLTKRTNCA